MKTKCIFFIYAHIRKLQSALRVLGVTPVDSMALGDLFTYQARLLTPSQLGEPSICARHISEVSKILVNA